MITKKNILIVTGWSFNDALIQTYTLPYVKIIKNQLPKGSEIYLFTQRQKSYLNEFDKNEKAKKELEQHSIFILEQEYSHFGIKAILKSIISIVKLIFLIFNKKITIIHTWCTPAGTIGYFLSILTRKPLIIDSYEPHAEAMVENGTWKKNSWAFKILFFFEKLQTKRAKACIGLTEKTPEYALRAYVKPACVDFDLFKSDATPDFSLINEPNDCKKIICVYAGKIGGIYLEKEIFEFFKACESYWKDNFKAIVLSNSPTKIIEQYILEVGLSRENIFYKEVPHADVNKYMSLASFALNPVKPVPTKRYCTSIKDGEYWAMGLPVVITANISDDSDIIQSNHIGSVLQGFSNEDYLNSIKQIDELLQQPKEELKHKIIQIAKKYRSFEIAEKVYSALYK